MYLNFLVARNPNTDGEAFPMFPTRYLKTFALQNCHHRRGYIKYALRCLVVDPDKLNWSVRLPLCKQRKLNSVAVGVRGQLAANWYFTKGVY